jgi:hypothetical protein
MDEPGYNVYVRFIERLVPIDGAGALGLPEEFQSINGMILTQQEGWKLFNPDDPSVDSVFWFGGGSMVSRTMTMMHYRPWTERRAEWQWGPGELDLPSHAPVHQTVSAAKKRPTGFVCGMGLAPPTVVGKFDVMLDVECKILVGMTADPKTGQPRPVINRQSLKGTWTIENGSYILLGVRKEPKPVEVYVPGLRKLPLVGRIFRESHNEGFLRLAALQIMVAEGKDSGKLLSSQFNIPE